MSAKDLIPWKPGQSGNPAGRPKGSRHKISEAFLKDFLEAWERNGKAALIACAADKPADFVKVAASLLPKEVIFKEETVADLTDEELIEHLRYVRSQTAGLGGAAPKRRGKASPGEVGSGESTH